MNTKEEPIPFSDLVLSRRLERAEGRSNADFVEARAKFFPDSGAQWIEVAGAYAIAQSAVASGSRRHAARRFRRG